jgi:predicted RNA-binding protein with TRAM domain
MSRHVRHDHPVALGEASQVGLPHVAGEGSGVEQEQGLTRAIGLVVEAHVTGFNDVTTLTGRVV